MLLCVCFCGEKETRGAMPVSGMARSMFAERHFLSPQNARACSFLGTNLGLQIAQTAATTETLAQRYRA